MLSKKLYDARLSWNTRSTFYWTLKKTWFLTWLFYVEKALKAIWQINKEKKLSIKQKRLYSLETRLNQLTNSTVLFISHDEKIEYNTHVFVKSLEEIKRDSHLVRKFITVNLNLNKVREFVRNWKIHEVFYDNKDSINPNAAFVDIPMTLGLLSYVVWGRR